MKALPTTLVAVALFSLAGVAPAADKPVDVAAETAALRAADKAYNESAADVEKRMSFLTDDATRIGPGGALVGKAAIRARATELKALPGFTAAAETKSAVVAASGDLGYTSGSGKVSVQTEGKVLTMPGHYLTVWKKQGGSWKVAVDSFTSTSGAETIK